jgi:drug/metabolite transporter (DMT)-like permease
VLFTAMAVIWGIPYLLIKVAVAEVEPVVLVLARTAIGALVLLPFAVRRGALSAALSHGPWVLAFAGIEIAVPWLLISDAEQHVSSSLAGLLIAAVPLVGAVIAWTSRSERVEPLTVVGLLVGLGGVAALLGLDVSGGSDLRAVAELLATAVLYAVGPVIVSRYLGGVPALGVNAAALAVTAVAYVPFAIPRLPSTTPSAPALASVLLLGVVCTALALLTFFALIGEIGPSRATVITYLNPAVAIALGVVLLGEPLTTGILVGFPLVILGSVLATRSRRPAPVLPAAVPQEGCAS